jgi:SAM-dependent methyltransferase
MTNPGSWLPFLCIFAICVLYEFALFTTAARRHDLIPVPKKGSSPLIQSVRNSEAALPLESCKICSGQVTHFIEKSGAHVHRSFQFSQCSRCRFVSVVNPITDYDKIYNDAYYEGRGADPRVDFAFELDHPKLTVRNFEWQGILDAVRHHHRERLDGVRWLDYGSGAGGLVRFLCDRRIEAHGFDVGAYADRARRRGIQILTPSELEKRSGSFDVVSLIEVLEHIPDPISLLQAVASLLRPGGLLFLTTGNAEPHRHIFASWGYVIPEVHVSYFSPESLTRALDRAGLQSSPLGKIPGLTNIVKYKILKTLGFKRLNPLFAILPWSLICRVTDRRYHLSAMPIATRSAPHAIERSCNRCDHRGG